MLGQLGMDAFFKQLFTLLTSETGSLAFHLVLAFSILGAIQMTFSLSHRDDTYPWKRLGLGLGLLLFLQLSLFAVSGLGWQGMIDSSKWLPPIDRAVLLLSTILIIWLWIQEKPSAVVDTAFFLSGLLITMAAVLGCLWWINQPSGLTFNYSWLDIAAQVTEIIILGVGVLILAIRRPTSWTIGICMFVILLLGPFLHFVLPRIQEDYSGAIRLSLMAAFPFLLMLPQRYVEFTREQEQIRSKEIVSPSPVEIEQTLSESQFLQSLSQLILETEPDQVCNAIVSALAQTSQADLCLMAKVVDEESYVVIECGYDQPKGRFLEKMAIPIQKLPLFVSSYRLGRIRKIQMQSSTPDLFNLTRALNLQDAGNVLFLPVLSQNGRPISCFIFLAPYSEKDWSTEEQSKLHQYARVLVYLLQHTQERLELQEEIDQTQKMLRLVQDQAQTTSLERQKLMDQLMILQEEIERGKVQTVTLGILSPDEVSAQIQINYMRAEIERLQKAAQHATEEQSIAPKGESDLRMALQEIARLRLELNETEQNLADLRTSSGGEIPGKINPEALTSIVEDFRHSISSIVENNNSLLEESTGVLDAAQRKYLDRIKASANRLNHLLEEIIQVASEPVKSDTLVMEELDLIELIGKIVQDVRPAIDQKNIKLELNLPKETIRIQSSASILNRVFTDLIENAIAVTKDDGMVGILVRPEHAEGKQDYVLGQVSDSGEGIDAQHIGLVFSPHIHALPIRGTNSTEVNFLSIKAMVESLSGRIWVDSEPGQGAIFSLLLPKTPQASSGVWDWETER